ncbi:MAG: insulinase family protein [Bacteroidales bacterium]|nr:insulinase family protein [Bacteroidales bacterium]
MISGTLPCGLRYAVKRSSSAVGYCSLSTRCGTRDEEGFHNGIAHFTEHTLFKGTSRKSASTINGYLDRLGGELNAFTTKEEIVLHATVLKEDVWKAAALLFELATDPTFPEDEIETEKGVVIDEINSYKDSPAEDAYDRFEQLLFEGHPLSSLILGTVSSVKKIGREELLRFNREKFLPGNMAFSIVADMDEKKMEKKVMQIAGKLFSSAGPQVPQRTLMKPAAPSFDKSIGRKSHQVTCIVGSTAPSLYEEEERLATVLLCNILGGPASNSILNSVLREKNGWVYNVECNYTQYADSGIVAICLGCEKDSLELCLKVIEHELGRLMKAPLSPARLKAAKKQILGQLAISSDNGETQCLSMGKSLLSYGQVSPDSRTREKVEAITAEQVMEAARRVFAEGKVSRFIYH